MNLLQMGLSGAVMILIIVVIRALGINKLPKKAFLVLWGVVVVRLLIPYSLSSTFSVYSLLGRFAATAETANGSPAVPFTPTAPTYNVIPGTTAANTTAPATVDPWIPGTAATNTTAPATVDPWVVVWVVGVLACAAFFAVAYWKCRKEFEASLPVDNEYAKQWLNEHRVHRSIEIRQSGRISAPLTYGVFRPIILMPKTVDWDDLDTLKYVLTHEYVHIRRFDAVTKLVLTVALCVHWFNPAVWIMYVLANRDIELSCDEAVIREFGERTKSAYAMALIRMEETRSGLIPFFNNFSKNATEERIIAVMKFKKTNLAGIALTLVLVLAMTVGFASNSSEPKVDPNTEAYTGIDADTQGTVISTSAPEKPEENGWTRVYGDGFYYDMPADGWNTDGVNVCLLDSAYGTGSQIEIDGAGIAGFKGAVELYKSLNYTQTEETAGLTVLVWMEVLEWMDGSVSTVRHEVYIYGQDVWPVPCRVVSLQWTEENLTEETANEPEVMRAIARSFTITGTDELAKAASSAWSFSDGPDNKVLDFRFSLEYLETLLAESVHDGVMTQEDAASYLASAKAMSRDGVNLEWIVPEDSRLFCDDVGGSHFGFYVYYKDGNGNQVYVDPVTVLSEFIFATDV